METRRHDLLTVLAIGMVVCLIKNVVHEGVGHGGVCVLVGGEPIAISSAWRSTPWMAAGAAAATFTRDSSPVR